MTECAMYDENEPLLPADIRDQLPSQDGLDIEEAFEKTNPFGKFQILMLIATFSVMLLLAYQQPFLYFIGYNPPWTCLSNNSSTFCNSNFGKEVKPGNINFTVRCDLRRDEWRYTRNKYSSYVTEFDLICNKSLMGAITGGVFSIGSAIAAPIAAVIADLYGRKPIYITTFFLTIIVSVLSSYVSAVWQLIVLRGVNGAVQNICLDIAVVLMSECVTTRHRPIATNIYLLAGLLSNLLADLVAYFESDWRILQRYCSLPALLFFIVFIFLPESPRWLLGAGKIKKCEKIMQKVARINGKSSLTLKLKLPASIDTAKKYTYFDCFKNPNFASLTLSICFCWLTNGLVGQTSMLLLPAIGNNMYANYAIITVMFAPMFCISAFINSRFGRKWPTLISCLLAGVISGVIAICLVLNKMGVYVVILTIILKGLTGIIFNGLYLWTFELYPTKIRLQGMSICGFMRNVGMASGPFLINLLENVSASTPFFVMFGLAIISALLGILLPETKDHPTRETLEDLENQVTVDKVYPEIEE